jgi:hypothetical protein
MNRELDESHDLLARGNKSKRRSKGYSVAALILETLGAAGIVGDATSVTSIPAPTLEENIIRVAIAVGGGLVVLGGYGLHRRSLREYSNGYAFYSQAEAHHDARDRLRRRRGQ